MKIERIKREHLRGLAALEALCFDAPWSEQALELLVGDTALGFTCLDESGTPIAYVGMVTVLDEGQITNVATHPDHRRQGLADKLLVALLAEARSRLITTLTLEVRESNAAAIALYRKHGFSAVGRRNHFYKNPREHALVMLARIGE